MLFQRCIEMVISVDTCMDYLSTQTNSNIRMTDVQSLPQCAVVLIESSYTHCKVCTTQMWKLTLCCCCHYF